MAGTLVILLPLAWFWLSSLVPDEYSVMDMGVVDLGGGPDASASAISHDAHGHAGAAGADLLDVSTLTGPRAGEPDVELTLVARTGEVELEGGRTVAGYTLNHSSPGPEIRAVQGDLIQVTLVNESVPDGVTLHWHGVDVPNAEDGVAGVTQDAVGVGQQHVYRFVAQDAGTYWYHSHQVSHVQVRRGLFGALVIDPPEAETAPDRDVLAVLHNYDGPGRSEGRSGRAGWRPPQDPGWGCGSSTPTKARHGPGWRGLPSVSWRSTART